MKKWQPPRGIRWQKQGEALVIVSEGPAGRGRKGSEQLAQRLLSLGGSEVWISEEFASRGPVQMLLRDGTALQGSKATLHCGFMNRCHDNVLALCAQDPARQWMAGFALGSMITGESTPGALTAKAPCSKPRTSHGCTLVL